MARTMSDEQEACDRVVVAARIERHEDMAAIPATVASRAYAELDAERAAHAETKQRLGAAHKEANITNEELCRDIAALKARLALAEAVCEYAYNGNVEQCHVALAAWRAGK